MKNFNLKKAAISTDLQAYLVSSSRGLEFRKSDNSYLALYSELLKPHGLSFEESFLGSISAAYSEHFEPYSDALVYWTSSGNVNLAFKFQYPSACLIPVGYSLKLSYVNGNLDIASGDVLLIEDTDYSKLSFKVVESELPSELGLTSPGNLLFFTSCFSNKT